MRIRFRSLVAALAAGVVAPVLIPSTATAQYFGRNKVQYETFDFRVLHTPHFDIHYYPAESLAVQDAGRMAERWYARHSALLQHTFDRKPFVIYANHPDFQQTNAIGGFIDQGTGGVTEGTRERVVLPLTGVYFDNDHVIGHELVHVFQYDIASQRGMGGPMAMNRLPLWAIEGMAEYLSLGRNDPNTAMWLRDATLRNDLPTIRKLSVDPRYFPYRYGEALWAYIGGVWGDQVVGRFYRNALKLGFERAIRGTLGLPSDTLSKRWIQAIREAYGPMMVGRQKPQEVGARVLARQGKYGDFDLSPALSPDGSQLAFLTQRGLFNVDLYIADATTGKIIKQLTGPNRDQHFDALSFIQSSGSWSPDGKKLAFVVVKNGDNQLAMWDVAGARIERTMDVPGVGEVDDPAWSPDGTQIAFSGTHGGISDLYLLDVSTGHVRQLTDDRYADMQPSWSPDGKMIAISTDRPGTSFDSLSYAPPHLAMVDLEGNAIKSLNVFPGAKQINPQWSPDGKSLYFVSDRGGFDDVYLAAIDGSSVTQITKIATGISGITAHSPALSVSRNGRMVMSVFENGGYTLRRKEATELVGMPLSVAADSGSTMDGGLLPPFASTGPGTVTASLQQPLLGLPPVTTEYRTVDYKSRYGLEYVGTTGIGVAVGGGHVGVAGSVQTYFGDMLEDHVIGASLYGRGTAKDIGGQALYLNQRRRTNWLLGASHTPQLFAGEGVQPGPDVNGIPTTEFDLYLQRAFFDQLSVSAQYPFSITRRMEMNASANHVWYSAEIDRVLIYNGTNTKAAEQLDKAPRCTSAAQFGSPCSPAGVAFGTVGLAYVGDYSYNAFTSPVAGGRYRAEISPTFGGLNFQSVLLDYRRYLFLRPITFAVRGVHLGRYGKDSESQQLQPLFLGEQQLVRGYEAQSFTAKECTGYSSSGTCPELARLIGSRLAVFNAELRLPIIGSDQFGIIKMNFIPIELSPFFDAGVAWTSTRSPKFQWLTNTTLPVPVASAGLSMRVNLLGYAVGEVYYAVPFQRPEKGGHFGVQLAPGW